MSERDRQLLEQRIEALTRENEGLRARHARLEHLLHAGPAVLYACSAEPPYPATFISTNVADWLGYRAEDFTGDPGFWAERIHPEDAPRVLSELRHIFESGRHVHEYRFRAADGSYVWVHDLLRLVRDADGKVIELVGAWSDVNETKQLELRLQQSQALAHIGSWELDHRTNRVWWSEETYRIFGLAPGAGPVSLETYVNAIHPDDRELADARFRESLEHRTGYDLAHRLVCLDGRVKHVQVQVRHTFDRDGQPLRSEGTIQDISELVRAQKRLRDILDSLPVFVGVCDVDGNVTDVSRLSLDLSGVKREEVVGKPIWETYWYSHSEKLQDQLRSVVARAAAGEVVRDEFRVRMGGHVFITADATFGPLRDESGNVVGVVGSGADITARMRLEQRMALAQAIGHLGSWEYDLVSHQNWWSDEQYRMNGRPPGTPVTQQLFLDLIHPEDRDRFDRSFARVLEVGEGAEHYRIVRTDGTVRHIQGAVRVEYGAADVPVKLSGVNLDVTDARENAEKMRTLLAEKETLLREVHHRVKNNLQIISSLLHFQSKKVKDPAAIAVFGEARNRLRSMILVHERLYRAGDLAHIDFGDYVQALTEELAISNPAAGARVSAHVEGPSPKLSVEIVLPAGMLLNELVTNSLKHAFPGRAAGAVRVAVCTEGDALVILVEDDGVGLPALSPEPSTFGLQLVQNLTRQLGATIELGPGPGTKLTVRVPISPHLPSGSPAPKELS